MPHAAPHPAVTNHPSVHHHPFFFVPAYDRAMTQARFRFMPHGPSADFLRGSCQRRSGPGHRSRTTSPIGRFRRRQMAAMSTSRPERPAWRVDLNTLRRGKARRLRRGRDARERHGRRRHGHHRALLQRTLLGCAGESRTGHALRADRHASKRRRRFFSSATPSAIRSSVRTTKILFFMPGRSTDRVWVTDRSGAKNRRLYARENRMQWVTHEVWVPGRRAVAFVDWPRGTRLIDTDSGERADGSRAFRPGTPRRDDGKRFVCDTNFPGSWAAHLCGRR